MTLRFYVILCTVLIRRYSAYSGFGAKQPAESEDDQLLMAIEPEAPPEAASVPSVESISMPTPLSSSCDWDALHVALKSVVPHPSRAPLTLNMSEGLNVSLHFTGDQPHPHIQVYVVTVTSTCTHNIKQLTFQAVVSKVNSNVMTTLLLYLVLLFQSMKVKLGTPTSTELAPSSPFLPPSVISQVMLVENASNVSCCFLVQHG